MDHLDKMVEAAWAEDRLWKLVGEVDYVCRIERDGVVVRTYYKAQPIDLPYKEFNELRSRAEMEVAYQAAQEWFHESVNRGNPVPDNVLWPRYGLQNLVKHLPYQEPDLGPIDKLLAKPTHSHYVTNQGDGIALMSTAHPTADLNEESLLNAMAEIRKLNSEADAEWEQCERNERIWAATRELSGG